MSRCIYTLRGTRSNTNRANKTPGEQKQDDVEDDESVDVGKVPDSEDGAHIKFLGGGRTLNFSVGGAH